jgi:hypothetical protein
MVAVPKAEELVATPYRHGGKQEAEKFFLHGMTAVMYRLAEQSHPAFPVTIYYAFKQSETENIEGTSSTGWETFLGAVTQAGFAVSATWPMRTERQSRSRGIGSNALASSIVLVCRPRDAMASTAYKLSDKITIHAGGGVFNDIIPAQVADLGATNAPYAPVFVGGINGQVGGVGIAPGVPASAVDATLQANQSFQSVFHSSGAPCAGLPAGAPTCPLAVNLNTFPSNTLKTPYFLQWSLGIERELGARGSLRVDYVGTRAVHEPYQVQLNGYQTVCDGCFAPFAHNQPLDQRFGNVNEFRTDARSNCTGLQTSATKQFGGLTLRANYTYSHCLDEVSNGGLLSYSSLGTLSPLPGNLRKESTATTTCVTTSRPSASTRFHFIPATHC